MAHPIYHPDGNYPDAVQSRIANHSSLEGFRRSRLPALSSEEVEYIKGTFDYLGLNHYTTEKVQLSEVSVAKDPSYSKDKGVTSSFDANWAVAASTWLKVSIFRLPKCIDQPLNYHYCWSLNK